MTDGEQQLKNYASSGDEAAFAAVVEAYAGLVYGVALRRVGNDPQAAEEVGQNVFAVVARKAKKISARPGLVAWLHRTTTLEAANFRRAESNRRQKMDDFRDQVQLDNEGTIDCSQALRPIIDEALDRMPESDRLAVLYHYFEGRDFREVGALLGKSDAAAQKQTRRALEKLGGLLRKRGITISAVALGSFLGIELGKAAPAGLAAALAKSSGAAAATGVVFAKPMVFSVAALLLALLTVVPLVSKGRRIAALKSELAELQAQAASGTSPKPNALSALVPGSAKSSSVERRLAELRKLPATLTAETLVRSWIRANGPMPQVFSEGPSFEYVSDAMRKLDADALWRIVAELDGVKAGGEVIRTIRSQLIGQDLGWKDPQRALEYTLEHRMRDEVLRNIIRRWATGDSAAAMLWLAKRRASGDLVRTRLDGDGPEAALVRGLIEHTARENLVGAVAMAGEASTTPIAVAALSGVAPALRAAGDHATFLDLANRLSDAGDRHRVSVDYALGLVNLCYRQRENVTAPLAALFDEPDFPEGQRDAVLREAAARVYPNREDFAMALTFAASAPEQRVANLAWLADRFRETHPSHFDRHWKATTPELATARRDAYASLIRHLAEQKDERAIRYLEKIDDAELRDRLGAEIEGP